MTAELNALELADLLDRSVLEVSRQAANELRRLYEMERALEMQGKALRSLEAQNTELDKKLAELEAEAQENARIIGMSAERELALRAEIDRLKKAVTVTAWAYGNLKERTPDAYLATNAVGHKFLRKKKPDDVYQPEPLYKIT